MKIIVHLGQGKTGTTALQESLHAAATELRANKVLYPQFGHGFVAHHLLLPLCGDPNRLPPWNLETLGGPEAAAEAAQVAWHKTREDIRRNPPELLVLSSEYLFRTAETVKARLFSHLSELSSDITPVIYVRHPVDHCRARLQQLLKHSNRHFRPVHEDLRQLIHGTDAVFGRSTELVAFARNELYGNDIVFDFATRFLAPWVQAANLKSLNANVGLSAEALVLLAHLRAEAGGSYEASRHVERLIPQLEALDRSDPPTHPFTLLPEVAEAALRSATSHRWLVETGKLHIPGLDVEKIDGAAPPDWMRSAPPESLFLHDPERLDRLRRSIERQQYTARSMTGPSAASKRGSGLGDRLLRFLHRKLDSLQYLNAGATLKQGVRAEVTEERGVNDPLKSALAKSLAPKSEGQ